MTAVMVHHRHWENEPCNDRCHHADPPSDAPGCVRIQKWNPDGCPCEAQQIDGSTGTQKVDTWEEEVS